MLSSSKMCALTFPSTILQESSLDALSDLVTPLLDISLKFGFLLELTNLQLPLVFLQHAFIVILPELFTCICLVFALSSAHCNLL